MNHVTTPSVENLVRTRIPTEYGQFMLHYYQNTLDNKEHIALVKGNVENTPGVLIRVHSECFTGDVLGSRRCDCRDQLQSSMRQIGDSACGVLIYLRQEGRGIGLLEKLKAYNLQDQGLDTVDANIHLGHRADERNYHVAALILNDLGIDSVKVLTNNPNKIAELRDLGIQVNERIPLEIPHHHDNADYLKTKAEKMAHMLSLGESKAPLRDMLFLQPLLNQLWGHQQRNTDAPFVTISYAQSIDGSIAFNRSGSITLSCSKSLEMTHLLRSRHDALMVGINTVLSDDPQLNVRYLTGKDPQPVILDSRLRFPLNARLLQNEKNPPIILTTEAAPEDKKRLLEEKGARVISVKANSDQRVDISSALTILHRSGLKTIMVEGGASVIGQFLGGELADYCIVTIVPQLIGGLKAVESLCRPQNTVPLTIANCQYHVLDSDIIVYGAVE